MSEALDRERNRVFIAVKNGRMAPEEAEALAKEKGFERFEATPDPSAFDPMTEAEWTLPMAAAWFIWRSPDAVRDQWDLARKGWKKWVPRPTSKRFRPRQLWRLKSFGRASLADVFVQAGFARGSGGARQRSSLDNRTTNPYDRLKEALQSGELVATRGKKGTKISEAYWRRGFDLLARPPKPPKPKSGPARENAIELLAITQGDIARRAQELAATLPDMPSDDSALAEALTALPDLGPDPFESDADDPQISPDPRPPTNAVESEGDDEEGIFVDRERVIEVERKISRREYETIVWDLGQTLGWVAYRNESDFRSLWAADLNPPPTYYGKGYPPDFEGEDPAAALRAELMSGTIRGYLRGKEMPRSTWLELAVWDCQDVRFRRPDVLRKIGPIAAPKVKRPANSSVEKMYLEFQQRKVHPSGVRAFYEQVKGQGVTWAQAREIHKRVGDALGATPHERGRKKGATKAP